MRTLYARSILLAMLMLVASLPSSRITAQANDVEIELVEFRNLALNDALKLLAEQSGLNLVASANASKVQVSLQLRDVTPMVVVKTLTRANGLVYRIEEETGIIHVATPEENARALAAIAEESIERFTLSINADNTIDLSIIELKLGQVIQSIADSTGTNIVATDEASNVVVTIQLKKVTPFTAIDVLCRNHGLLYRLDSGNNIVHISRSAEGDRRADDFSIVNVDDTNIALTVHEVPLGEVLQVLSERTGLNLVPSGEAAGTKVSIHLSNVDPMDAVRALCAAYHLWYKVDEATDITQISTAEEYQRDLSSFREEKTIDFTLMYANSIEVALAIRDLFGDRVQLNLGDTAQEIEQDLEDRLNRLEVFGGSNLGFAGTSGNSTGTSNNNNNNNRNNNNNNVNNNNNNNNNNSSRSSNNRRTTTVEEEPEELSPEVIQALTAAGGDVETIDRILNGQRANVFVTVVGSHNKVVVRTSDSRTMEQIKEVVTQLDVPTPLVLLEVKVMSIVLGDGFRSVFDYQFTDAARSALNFAQGDILPPIGDSVGGDARRDASLGLLGTGLNTGDLTFQFVDRNFRGRVQLLEDENRITALATPLLLTANNEASRLFIGEERPLNRSFTAPTETSTGFETVNNPGSTDIEFRNVGTSLLITPTINADRTVTLRVLQETSSIIENGATVLVPTLTSFDPTPIDIVRSQNISGTIVAKDGYAVAIGGLIEEEMRDTEEKVPFLGDIPLLGYFFKRVDRGKSRSEIVVMIRPYVLNTPSESEKVSRDLLDKLSLHPNAPDGEGTLGIHSEDEVLQPNGPNKDLSKRFRFHSTMPGRSNN